MLLKRLWWLSFLAFVMLTLLFVVRLYVSFSIPKMIFCDVGQGDAAIFMLGTFQMLIDGGPDNKKALICLNKHLPWPDRTIEIAVVTHFDLDHYGGLPDVMDKYRIEHFIRLPFSKNDDYYLKFREKLGNSMKSGDKRQRIIYDFSEKKYQISDHIEISFWNNYKDSRQLKEFRETEAYRDNISDINNEINENNIDQNPLSIATLIRVDETMILMTGDMDQKAELALIQSGLLTQLSILKVGHHGSKTSSSGDFIEFSLPESAVISAGSNNSYGHPHPEVIDVFQANNVDIFRTDELGDIVFKYVGDKWRLVPTQFEYFI